MAAEAAVLALLVQCLEVGVVGADDGFAEHQRLGGDGHRLDQVGGVGPVGLQSVVRYEEPELPQLTPLPVER